MYVTQHRSWTTRVGFRIARFVGFALLYGWLGLALYLWSSSDFYPDHGLLARLYLAFRDGLVLLPDAIQWVAGFLAAIISWTHQALVSDLGYDPVAFPSVSSDAWGRQAVGTDSIVSQFVAGAVYAGTWLSAFQFGVLFVLSLLGTSIGWKHPGIPVIFSTVANLVYLGAVLAVAVWLSASSFATGVVAGIAGSSISAVLAWRPLLAGLPLWLLYVFGLRPRVLLLIPFMIIDLVIRSGSKSSSSQRETEYTGRNTGSFATDDELGGDTHANRMPAASNTEERVESACGTLSISPDEFRQPQFEQRTLVSRFHKLAKKLHPDASGSERLMMILNEDYEYLLTYKGWRR